MDSPNTPGNHRGRTAMQEHAQGVDRTADVPGAGTDEQGSHPIGTGAGVLAGGAVGAAAGILGGPAGMLVGAVTGAVLGGLGGKAAAEAVNPTAEQAYWQENYTREPYYESGRSYEDYGPAYDLGFWGRTNYGGSFEETQNRLAADWETRRSQSTLQWEKAREPIRAAWNRVDSQLSHLERNHHMQQSGSQGQKLNQSGGSTNTSGRTSGWDDNSSTSRSSADYSSSTSSSATQMDTDDVIDTLNDLVECSRDGEYGFRECAEHCEAPSLKTTLMRHAEECRTAAAELESRIRQLGGEPAEGGTSTGAMHRGWVSLKGTLAGYSDRAMLEECERGEDVAVARYRKALKENLPTDIRTLVERQAQGAERNHAEVKALRDSLQDRA